MINVSDPIMTRTSLISTDYSYCTRANIQHVVVAVDNTLTSKFFLISHLDIIGFVL